MLFIGEFLSLSLPIFQGKIVVAVNAIHRAAPGRLYSSAQGEPLGVSIDLFLYDLKTLDDAKHRDYTGVSNRIILENLGCLSRWGKNVIVRVPVIPGVNDDLDEIRKLGLFIASLGNVHEIQVLPYHRTGVEKYQRLGNDYQMPQTVPPSGEKIETVANELRQHVASVCIGG